MSDHLSTRYVQGRGGGIIAGDLGRSVGKSGGISEVFRRYSGAGLGRSVGISEEILNGQGLPEAQRLRDQGWVDKGDLEEDRRVLEHRVEGRRIKGGYDGKDIGSGPRAQEYDTDEGSEEWIRVW